MFSKYKKGWRSTIYLDQEKALIKKVTNGRGLSTIENEVRWLKRVNLKGIGPKLIDLGDDYFICEFIDGILFEKFLLNEDKNCAKKVVRSLLKQCYLLDKLKIDKKEMNNPYKHIIIRNNNAVMIDFERARYCERPHNLSGFCQYLMSGKIQSKFKFEVDLLKNLIKEYKKNYSINNFRKILRVVLK